MPSPRRSARRSRGDVASASATIAGRPRGHITMTAVLLFLLAFILGVVSAVPLGGSQIEVARRALGGHMRAAVAVALGSASSDVVYGCVALFGISPFVSRPAVVAWFYLAGGVVLLVLAYHSFRQSSPARHADVIHPLLRKRRVSFVVGFVLAFSNPQMVITWLIGKGIAEQLGVVTTFTPGLSAIFVVAGGLGLMSYLVGVALALSRLKRFVPFGVLRRIYYWLGFVLVGLSLLFFSGSARMWLMKPNG